MSTLSLKNINKICGRKLFDKNSLFVRSSTLWEIMQPVGGKGSHNFHGLKSEDILGALKGAIDPYSVYIARNKRIAVCTLFENFEHEKLLIVIELHCGLESDRFANINKIVSVYPKYNIDNLLLKLDKKEILYIKKENRTGLQ